MRDWERLDSMDPNVTFDPGTHLCPRHRPIYFIAKEHGTRNVFVHALIHHAMSTERIQRHLTPSEHYPGRFRLDGVAEALVAESPICCLVGHHRVTTAALAADLAPCGICSIRRRFFRYAYLTKPCGVCFELRWRPALSIERTA